MGEPEPSGAWHECTRCHRRFAAAPVVTVTGRRLCAGCDRAAWGLTAAAGHGANSPDRELASVQLVHAWRDLLFRRRR